ncbi:hypothetical protein [uncultured Shewanella sp.]|uniref:hypothetical protein n=1 Tax=uncultured Shewanella sp. TaxID=173975 RepID=UPI002609DAA8|nr:hypothetical protein [uncultured Shewanella sp.]
MLLASSENKENLQHTDFTKYIFFTGTRQIVIFVSIIFLISCSSESSNNEPSSFTPTLTSNILLSNHSTDLIIYTNAEIPNSETISIIDEDELVSFSSDHCSITHNTTHCSVTLTASHVSKTTSGTLRFNSSNINSSFTPENIFYTITPSTSGITLSASFSNDLISGQAANLLIQADKAATSAITITATDYNSQHDSQTLGYLYYTNGAHCTINIGDTECTIAVIAGTVVDDIHWTMNLTTFNPNAHFTTSTLDYIIYASDTLQVQAYLSPNPLASGETGWLFLYTSQAPVDNIDINITDHEDQLTLSASSCEILANTTSCMIEVTATEIDTATTGTLSFTTANHAINSIDYDIDPQTFIGLVRGWPNYLAMGNITDADIYNGTDLSSTQVSLTQYPMNAIFKYAGTGLPTDPNALSVTYPYQTYQTLAQTSFLTVDYDNDNALPDNSPTIKPVMVVYTANASYDWYSPVNDFTGDVMMNYFSKLILIAQLLEKKGMGSVILNPDFLGTLEKNIGSTTDYYAQINEQLANNGDYTVENSLNAAISFVNTYQSFVPDCSKAIIPLELFNVLIECGADLDTANTTWDHIMTTAGPKISKTRGANHYATPNVSSNDVIAWITATNWIMNTFAPNISYGWQENLWATGDSTWIYDASSNIIDSQAAEITGYLEAWSVFNGDYQPDFIVIDRYEGDDFMPAVYDASYLYNSSDWYNYTAFVGKMSDNTNKPAMIWQIPGAHIQRFDDIDDAPTRVAEQHGGTAPNFFFSETQGGMPAVDFDNLIAYIDTIPTLPDYLKVQPDGNTEDTYYWNEGHLKTAIEANIFSILWGGENLASGAIDISLNPDLYDNGWLGTRIRHYLNGPEYFATETQLPFCVWLNPDTQDQAVLDAIVVDNIQGTSCPFFNAHITLFCGSTYLPKQALVNQFLAAFMNESATDANVLGVQWGIDFFKRFYYQMKNTDQLDSFYEQAKNALDEESTYQFAPHISLFYGNDSDIPADKILAAPHLETIDFNQISLMSDCSAETYECVASWEEYASVSLDE